MQNKISFSENDLHKLLNQSFLETRLNKPGNEKLIETISVEVFAPKSFYEKLTTKISLQALLVSTFILYAGVNLLFIIEPDTIQPHPTDAGSGLYHDSRQAHPSGRQTGGGGKGLDKTTTPSTLSNNENTIQITIGSSSTTYNDSITDMAVQPLETIHVNDPAIRLPKNDDSLSLNSSVKEKKTLKNKKTIKRKSKTEWREHEVK